MTLIDALEYTDLILILISVGFGFFLGRISKE